MLRTAIEPDSVAAFVLFEHGCDFDVELRDVDVTLAGLATSSRAVGATRNVERPANRGHRSVGPGCDEVHVCGHLSCVIRAPTSWTLGQPRTGSVQSRLDAAMR
jgi:hypothetical protein